MKRYETEETRTAARTTWEFSKGEVIMALMAFLSRLDQKVPEGEFFIRVDEGHRRATGDGMPPPVTLVVDHVVDANKKVEAKQ